MNAQQEEALDVLHHLLSICRDGQEGFRTAAQAVQEDAELKMLLSSFSLQRAKFAGELEAQAMTMGEHHPEREGSSLKGAAHRGWIHLKAALSGGSNHSILSECERGEDVAKEAYQQALRHHLPEPVLELVKRQRQEVITTHNTIRALRDAAHFAGNGRTMRGELKEGQKGASDIWHEIQTRHRHQAHAGSRLRHPVATSLVSLLVAGSALAILLALWRNRPEPPAHERLWRTLREAAPGTRRRGRHWKGRIREMAQTWSD